MMTKRIIKIPGWLAWAMPGILWALRRLGIMEAPEIVYQCRLCDMEVAEYALDRHLKFHHPEVQDE